YNVAVRAPDPDADIVHTSAVYFIGPGGTERYIATPMADHTSSGTAYLPAGQIAAWGRGIALVAKTLTPQPHGSMTSARPPALGLCQVRPVTFGRHCAGSASRSPGAGS